VQAGAASTADIEEGRPARLLVRRTEHGRSAKRRCRASSSPRPSTAASPSWARRSAA
jgi:hypothetical protein